MGTNGCGGCSHGRSMCSFPGRCLNHETTFFVLASAPSTNTKTSAKVSFLNNCIRTIQVDESEDTRICLPSEPSLHRPTSDDTVALVWVVDHTSVLHQVQQFARAQIDRLAPFCLAFLAFKIELDLHRQLRGRETVTRRCHCVLCGFQLNQSLRGRAL